MNTRRVNDKYHRQDIKIPVGLYNRVCDIATNEFKARVHHISNKPEITSTLLYLVELGIESLNNGNELTKKPNTDNHTDTIPITDNEVKELIKKALLPMYERLNDLVTIQSQVDELKTILYRLTNTDTNTDTNIYVENLNNTIDVSTTDINTDTLTDTLTDNITEDNAPLELPILPVNEDSGVIVPNEEKSDNNSDIPLIDNKIKTFEDAIKKILELKSEGKTNTAIAKELTGKYHTAKGMTDWKDIQVKRILQKLENNFTDTQKK